MRLIDADAFDERVRVAGGMSEEELTEDFKDGVLTVLYMLSKQPTIQSEPHWVPCSETVDIPDHEIIACDAHGELIIGYLEYKDEQWICESDVEMMYDPIAWMEKPELYKGE